MQVQLKQSEIEAALKGYIAQQGINLANKSITYSFTAGRKDSGISVELEIEELAIAVPQKVAAETIKAPVFASAFHNETVTPPLEPIESEIKEPSPTPPTTSLFT